MKKNKLLFLICLCCLNVFAGNIPVTSKIESVTVYRQGAEVVNTASVDVPAGNSEVVFEGLSNNVSANSLQVTGTQGITLLSAIYRMNFLKGQEKLPEAVKVQDSIDIATLELAHVTAKKKVFTEEEDLLIANQSIGGN